MKRSIGLSLFIIFLFAISLYASDGKELTIKDIFGSRKFSGKSIRGLNWLPDSKAFTFIDKKDGDCCLSIYIHDVKSGKISKLVDGSRLIEPGTKDTLKIEEYNWSESGKKLMIKTDSKRVWRRNSLARFYIYDLKVNKITPVYEGDELISNAKLSPDETMVGYVLDNNIYIKDLNSGKTIQITKDGSDVIINGQFDWVYEEEFGIADGWLWSPDSKKIAFWRLDQSEIPLFTWMDDYFPKYGIVKSIHYPKAGEKNSEVKVAVYHIDQVNTVWIDLGNETDIYIPRIQWTKNADLLSFQRLNRLQNKNELFFANAIDGTTTKILEDTDPAWVDVYDDLTFINSKNDFLWTSERDGFKHIYFYNAKGKMIKQLTSGEWEVGSIQAYNEKDKKVLFSSNKEHVTQNQIYSVGLNGQDFKKLTKISGSHRAEFSPDGQIFVDTYSNLTTPSKIELVNVNGKSIRKLEENPMDILKEYDLSYPELITFKTTDGVTLNASMLKPADFDPNKKYPVLIYGYGGPGSQMVRNSWSRQLLWYNLLGQKGYIIFTLDNRGTGGRGKAFKNLAYKDIGKYAEGDHVEGSKFLATLPYVDKDRIGIWGWSGGGYLTMMCMTKGSEYFKAGVAVASVTDFRLYDTIWTERYMGLPDENSAGYDSASVQNYVKNYKGGMLIVHGLSDDNVHVQNSMQVIERFQQLNKPFTMMLYPEKNHSMRGRKHGPGVTMHLYTTITNFILNNL